jgi:Icc-related predicted phosphoesterase
MKIFAIGDFHGKFPERLKKLAKSKDIDLIIGLGDYTGLPEWRPIVLRQLRAAKTGKEVPDFERLAGKKKYTALVKKDFRAGLEVLRELNGLGKPCIIIFGNGDWYRFFGNKTGKDYEGYIKQMKNLKQINYRRTKFMGMNFVGFGGYMDIDSYFKKKEWKDADAKSIKIRLKRRNQSKRIFFKNLRKAKGKIIFVLHYPPKGAFDIIHGGRANPLTGKSTGISFFRDAIRKFKPRLVLCGHMHEYQGKKKLVGSLVVNPGDAERGRAAIIDYPSLRVRFIK